MLPWVESRQIGCFVAQLSTASFFRVVDGTRNQSASGASELLTFERERTPTLPGRVTAKHCTTYVRAVRTGTTFDSEYASRDGAMLMDMRTRS